MEAPTPSGFRRRWTESGAGNESLAAALSERNSRVLSAWGSQMSSQPRGSNEKPSPNPNSRSVRSGKERPQGTPQPADPRQRQPANNPGENPNEPEKTPGRNPNPVPGNPER